MLKPLLPTTTRISSARTSSSMTRLTYIAIGQIGLVALWEAIARSGIAGLTIPTLSSVIGALLQPNIVALLSRSARATLISAATGMIAGSFLGVCTALLSHLFSPLRPGLDRLAVTVNAIPAVALGPIFILLAGRDVTPALLATIAVSFLIYVAVSSGLRSAPITLATMMTTFGARKWQQLIYLELPSALPSFLSGVKVSVTAAMIGSVVGEWFGAPTGLGVVILNTMQNFEIPLLWASVLTITVLSLAGYGAAHLVQHFAAKRLL